MNERRILWRRVDLPGHEAAVLRSDTDGWKIEGTAVFLYEHQPVRLSYELVCDDGWKTLRAIVGGWIGRREVDVEIEVHASAWLRDGAHLRNLEGCNDLDLSFSPSTNLLPIRRLNLPVGKKESVRAAWLGFPRFELEPLEQDYERLGPTLVRYSSDGGKFVRDLEIDEAGFVVSYPGMWEEVR